MLVAGAEQQQGYPVLLQLRDEPSSSGQTAAPALTTTTISTSSWSNSKRCPMVSVNPLTRVFSEPPGLGFLVEAKVGGEV